MSDPEVDSAAAATMPTGPLMAAQPVSLASRRVLVTGARGFLGTHLCRALLAAGCEVHGMVRTPPPGDASIRWWQADAADAAAVEAVVSAVKPEIVFHLTSHAWGAPDLDKVLPTLQDDLVANVNVMTAAARAGVGRMITTNSMQEPESGDALAVPMSPYAAAKWAGAAYARMFHQVFALPVVFVRLFMVYGPGQPVGKVIPSTIRALLQDQPPQIAQIAQGGQLVDWIYIDDAIAGLLRAAAVPGLEGQTIEIGAGKAWRLADIVDRITTLMASSVQAEYGSVARPLEQLRVADVEETWRLLGWRAEVPLNQGLQTTIEACRAAWSAESAASPQTRTAAQKEPALLPLSSPEVDEALGADLHRFAGELYPICRSITGDGVRQTLALIASRIPLLVHEVPSGTQVFDWTIPREWNIRDAYIRNGRGEKIVDFRQHNLSVLNYSVPVSLSLSLDELRPHLYSLPDQPDAIPYRTSYHQEAWGFCLPHRQLMALPEDRYEVVVDSTLEPGHLTYGELLIPGASDDEVLVSCHVCHPSLSDDNLSGIVVATELARYLATVPHRYSYRFVFVPGTIGSVTWLARNTEAAKRIKHGVVLTCVGDAANFTYKRSRRGAAEIDLAFEQVLQHLPAPGKFVDFSPYGYDERQYCSPGFNLAVGCLMRGVHGEFPEYHTSNDNPDFLKAHSLAETVTVLKQVFELIEHNQTFRNTLPFGEPQLGKRGLYRSTGGTGPNSENMAMLWLLNQADGSQSLLDISRRSGMNFATVVQAARALAGAGLLVAA